MNDNEQPGCSRTVVAIIAAAGVGFLLAFIPALWAGSPGAAYQSSDAAVYGSFLGWIGASAGSLRRANFAGASICAIYCGLLALLVRKPSFGIYDRLWLMAAAGSFGSICAQVGVIIAGPVTKSDESPKAVRFTLKQLLTFSIPVAVYFGCLSALMRK